MRARRARLTDAMVSALKPGAQEYEVHDTAREGVRLRVGPGGTKSWSYFYHRDGRNRRLGLGRYPTVRLSKAGELAANEFGRIKGPERADPAQEIVGSSWTWDPSHQSPCRGRRGSHGWVVPRDSQVRTGVGGLER